MLHFCTVNKNKRRRERNKRRELLTTDSETFHEIIYGKSERGANERRVFFVDTVEGGGVDAAGF